MLDTEPLTLAHPAVQAAKAKWDEASKYTPRKHGLTFEDLFEYFKVDCVRQSAVAVEAGLTRERIRQIYNKYFRELFESKSGNERRRACTLESHIVKTKQAENTLLETDVVIKALVEKARAAGCTVDAVAVIVKGILHGTVLTKRLFINGHLCSLHHLEKKWTPSAGKRQYVHGHVSLTVLSKVEACIFHLTLEDLPVRTFVIPSLILQLRRRGSGPKTGGSSIFFPVEKLSTPSINYWQYEDAWHLLPPKQDAPAL